MASGNKLTFFIIIPVVGKVCFRHDAQHLSPVDGQSAVEQLSPEAKGRAHQQDGKQGFAFIDELPHGLSNRFQQRILVKQVLVGKGGNPQFRKERHCGMMIGSAVGKR